MCTILKVVKLSDEDVRLLSQMKQEKDEAIQRYQAALHKVCKKVLPVELSAAPYGSWCYSYADGHLLYRDGSELPQ